MTRDEMQKASEAYLVIIQFTYLNVADLPDELEAEEIREDLGDVIDHGRDTEEGRGAAVILKMPEEKSEDQSDAESHEPRDEKERGALEILELLQHRYPFRYLFHRLSKHFSLKQRSC